LHNLKILIVNNRWDYSKIPKLARGLEGGEFQHPVSKTILPRGVKKNFKKFRFYGVSKKIFKKYGINNFFLLNFAPVFSLRQILVP
jgi:hypothetical protein